MSELVRYRRMFEHAAWASAAALEALRLGPGPRQGAGLAGAHRRRRAALACPAPARARVDAGLARSRLAACGEELVALADAGGAIWRASTRRRSTRGRLPQQQRRVLDQHRRATSSRTCCCTPHYHRGQIASAQREAGGRRRTSTTSTPCVGADRVSAGASAGPADRRRGSPRSWSWAAGVVGRAGWFGRLPGDIRIERDTLRVYIPIVSMLVVSAALSVVLYLLDPEALARRDVGSRRCTGNPRAACP